MPKRVLIMGCPGRISQTLALKLAVPGHDVATARRLETLQELPISGRVLLNGPDLVAVDQRDGLDRACQCGPEDIT